tara:strand:+ start:2013 stop:2336 length:324 start_codon:yes stop_codon:yes gene_type:complete
MKNIGQLMKQAQQMQTKMAELQDKLAEMTVEGTSGGGLVTVIITCKNEIKSLKIDPSLIDPSEADMLEDLIVAAINDARTKAEAKTSEEMSQLTGGMKLPGGMEMPF